MRSRISRLLFVVVVVSVVCNAISQSTTMSPSPEGGKPLANAAIQECKESAPSVFLPVLLTLVAVCVVMLFVFVFWKYYWRIKHGKHLVLVTDVEKGEPEYAFDNPGFREGTPVSQAKKPADLKEKVSNIESNGSQQQQTQQQQQVHQPLSNGHKPQSLDENASNKSSSDTKTNVIPLKSRDFTGLGFNICGNMRDGIYVKDLLHHGPASETGRIKAGDRISAIRINFSHMVYEDAMAILSYASPYDVEIEVEDSSMSPDSLKNTSLNNHIAHSFYRSQSFSTAQHIQKIIPRKLNFNAPATKNDSPSEHPKVAVLEVSDKMCKFGGIRVLPDIKCEPTTTVKMTPLQQAEKQQNATVIDVECDSGFETKTPTTFDEVDLSGSSAPAHGPEKVTSSIASTFKDHNMKKALVKGIQNLKEKLNNHIHQKSCDKVLHKELETESKSSERPSASDEPDSGLSRARSNSESDDGDETTKKISKRKAPLPPAASPSESPNKPASDFNLLNEIENEVNKNTNYENKDDSENENDAANNTIELNSSHITVHHAPEESNRKAASLGDLSKIADNDSSSLVPLERAVSLELAEHTPRGSKKCKAPMPPEECSEEPIFKEPKIESALSCKLKKSSLFGTLEEAIKPNNSSDDSDYDQMLPSSTPMKLSDETLPNVASMNWDLSFEALDDAKDEDVFLDDEKVPDLPNSPMPDGPTFVTEIKVSNDDDDLSHVSSNDLTLFMTAAEINTSNERETNVEHQLLSLNHDKAEINGTESEDSKDSSIDTVKEATCNGTSGESKTELPIETSNTSVGSVNRLKFSKENMSDEQILALSNSLTHQPTSRYRAINSESSSMTSKKKSPSTSTKLPKLSNSTPPVRAVGSRIPVRANTEPSLKVSLINNIQSNNINNVNNNNNNNIINNNINNGISSNNKDDTISKTRKYKISEEPPVENGKATFTPTSHHLPSTTHKTSVLSENRHNGPNR